MNQEYTENNPFGDTVEVYDVEREKELVREQELKDENNKNNKR